jgi:hypothetical protein
MPYSFINNEELNEHERERERYTVELGYHNRHNPYVVPQRNLNQSYGRSLHPFLDFVMFLFLAFMLSFIIIPGAAYYAGGSPLYYLLTSLICTIISYSIYFKYFYKESTAY